MVRVQLRAPFFSMPCDSPSAPPARRAEIRDGLRAVSAQNPPLRCPPGIAVVACDRNRPDAFCRRHLSAVVAIDRTFALNSAMASRYRPGIRANSFAPAHVHLAQVRLCPAVRIRSQAFKPALRFLEIPRAGRFACLARRPSRSATVPLAAATLELERPAWPTGSGAGIAQGWIVAGVVCGDAAPGGGERRHGFSPAAPAARPAAG